MSIEQGIIQAMIASSAIMMYMAFKLDDRHQVFGLFLYLVSLLFQPITLFTAVAIADVNNFQAEVVSVVSYAALGLFMVFFFALLYFGVVVYSNDAINLVNQEDQNQFNWQEENRSAV